MKQSSLIWNPYHLAENNSRRDQFRTACQPLNSAEWLVLLAEVVHCVPAVVWGAASSLLASRGAAATNHVLAVVDDGTVDGIAMVVDGIATVVDGIAIVVRSSICTLA